MAVGSARKECPKSLAHGEARLSGQRPALGKVNIGLAGGANKSAIAAPFSKGFPTGADALCASGHGNWLRRTAPEAAPFARP